jgi:hypothetical protein
MSYQRLIPSIEEQDSGFDAASAPMAPRQEQVAQPDPEITSPAAIQGWRLLAAVLGNVVLGSAWLLALLAAPGFLGRMLGLV